MLRRLRAHITYANVASTAALVAALGGGAYAAASTGIPDRHGVFHGCVSSPSGGSLRIVKKAKACHKGPQPELAIKWSQKGPPGQAGAPGSALAYAHITVAGGVSTVDAASSRSIVQSSVVHSSGDPTSVGTTCFRALGFTPHSVVATPDLSATNASGAVAAIGDLGGSGCPAGTVVVVRTESGPNTGADGSFWVLFD